MRLPLSAGIAIAVFLAACSNAPPPASTDPAPPRAIGGDRDAHGCLPAAGYQWCARTNQCERPLELAKAENFENTASSYEAYCNAYATGVSPPAS